ncbi:nucleotide pyrophosphohydrolase [Achromobacter sp. HNDS-1]|uniref:Nucleotide pyrophosphohydrolase n=1 Tax=Achromobacter sp. HNDS-1 TaxID=3151598 RepID=A0AAU7LIU8_9BURK
MDIARLTAAQDQFAKDRDWEQFHSPKNLVMALTGEVGELSEIFQWMSEADSKNAGTNPATVQAVKDELADVLLYLVRLSSTLGVDLNEAVTQKLQKNAQKYPADKVKGKSKKYSDY